jgi:mono/diheme cytochrome c family protein
VRAFSQVARSTLVSLGLLALATPAAAQTQPQARIDRGQGLASANCSSCHAVGPAGASPNRRAPPFRTLSGRYVGLTLHRKLTEIAETGHYDMPPAPVHTDEVDAIAAYINSLDPSGAPPRP